MSWSGSSTASALTRTGGCTRSAERWGGSPIRCLTAHTARAPLACLCLGCGCAHRMGAARSIFLVVLLLVLKCGRNGSNLWGLGVSYLGEGVLSLTGRPLWIVA